MVGDILFGGVDTYTQLTHSALEHRVVIIATHTEQSGQTITAQISEAVLDFLCSKIIGEGVRTRSSQ